MSAQACTLLGEHLKSRCVLHIVTSIRNPSLGPTPRIVAEPTLRKVRDFRGNSQMLNLILSAARPATQRTMREPTSASTRAPLGLTSQLYHLKMPTHDTHSVHRPIDPKPSCAKNDLARSQRYSRFPSAFGKGVRFCTAERPLRNSNPITVVIFSDRWDFNGFVNESALLTDVGALTTVISLQAALSCKHTSRVAMCLTWRCASRVQRLARNETMSCRATPYGI